jgi:hypothetical protein
MSLLLDSPPTSPGVSERPVGFYMRMIWNFLLSDLLFQFSLLSQELWVIMDSLVRH